MRWPMENKCDQLVNKIVQGARGAKAAANAFLVFAGWRTTTMFVVGLLSQSSFHWVLPRTLTGPRLHFLSESQGLEQLLSIEHLMAAASQTCGVAGTRFRSDRASRTGMLIFAAERDVETSSASKKERKKKKKETTTEKNLTNNCFPVFLWLLFISATEAGVPFPFMVSFQCQEALCPMRWEVWLCVFACACVLALFWVGHHIQQNHTHTHKHN